MTHWYVSLTIDKVIDHAEAGKTLFMQTNCSSAYSNEVGTEIVWYETAPDLMSALTSCVDILDAALDSMGIKCKITACKVITEEERTKELNSMSD